MRLLVWVYVVACVALRADASSPVNLEAIKISETESLTAKNNEQDSRHLRRANGKLTTAEEERAFPGTILSHDSTDMVNIPLLDASPSHSIPSLQSKPSNSLASVNFLPSLPSLFGSVKAAALDKAVGMVDISKDVLPYKTVAIFTLFKFFGVKPFTIYWRHGFDDYWIKVAKTYEEWLARSKAGSYKKPEANGKDLDV